MQVYLVGGAVRDRLMDRAVIERDWVVVGATPEHMLAEGYQQVGSAFPVYLHPETKEEYALARKEKKVAQGYQGFVCDFGPEVTLEEDLLRRDLTVNAIAESADGALIDPHHGVQDIQQKILRHVSPAFSEDPVRLLRVARFAARFGDFQIASETIALMQTMVQQGEVDALMPERVWKEFEKALGEDTPARFLTVLNQSNALKVIFPELASQYGVVIDGLQRAGEVSQDSVIRFAVLCHQLDVLALEQLIARYRIPQRFADIAALVVRHLSQWMAVDTGDKKACLDLFYALDAFRRPARFEQCLEAAVVVANISGHVIDGANINAMLQCVLEWKVDLSPVPTLKGKAIADYIYQQRLAKLLS